MPVRLLPMILALALTACTADGPPPSNDPGAAPVLVVSAGNGGGGDSGMTVREALGHRATDDLVFVSGALFVDPDGTVRLCDAIAESFPPQCGGERIEVRGLDLATVPGLQQENGVQWAESVLLFGSVE